MSDDKRDAGAIQAGSGVSCTAAPRDAGRRHAAAKAADGALESLKANAGPGPWPREAVPYFETAATLPPPLMFRSGADA